MSQKTAGLTSTQWLICIIAAMGFAFDIYELLMLPLIVRPALQELVGATPGSPEFQMWVGRLFYIPAFAGGGMHNVTIAFPGLPEITGLRASSGVVDELRKAAAMAQVRSGGRKPSRYS